MTVAKVALGEALFADPVLSADGSMACATCHDPARAFSAETERPSGITGELMLRNAPSLLNVGYRPLLGWANPSVDSLEQQALTPLFGEEPMELGNGGAEDALLTRLDGAYGDEFDAVFGEPPTVGSLVRALGAYQRSLLSLDSPWDRDPGDASLLEVCVDCHAGEHLGGEGFEDPGTWDPASDDAGLAEFSGDEADNGLFRVPSLRDVADTGPWLHDGSAATLRDAVERHQRGRPDDVDAVLELLPLLSRE
ncbi:MAG: cytochrome-c peroxidase [Proteobacteria bacterium]|nr:cytochrome-c peroxidase [Pseudomonadota bacterium]